MKIETNEKGEIILKEVYSGVGLETSDGEFIGICMRDSGFEFNYEGNSYSAQKGNIEMTDVTTLYNTDKAKHILNQLINTPGLMNEFNKQLRSYKLDKMKKK